MASSPRDPDGWSQGGVAAHHPAHLDFIVVGFFFLLLLGCFVSVSDRLLSVTSDFQTCVYGELTASKWSL